MNGDVKAVVVQSTASLAKTDAAGCPCWWADETGALAADAMAVESDGRAVADDDEPEAEHFPRHPIHRSQSREASKC